MIFLPSLLVEDALVLLWHRMIFHHDILEKHFFSSPVNVEMEQEEQFMGLAAGLAQNTNSLIADDRSASLV